MRSPTAADIAHGSSKQECGNTRGLGALDQSADAVAGPRTGASVHTVPVGRCCAALESAVLLLM